MAKQQRNNDYYLQRLKKDRPDLYLDVQARRITVTKARKLAGNLGATRTRLSEMKNAWAKASPKERLEFQKWAGLTAPLAVASRARAAAPATNAAFDVNGMMVAWVRRRIPEIMSRRSLRPGDLADELGISRLDQSIMRAVRRGTRIRSSAIAVAVDAWLTKNASV